MCPESADVHSALSDVCIGEVEAALAAQRQADWKETQQIKAESKQAAEQEEKERLKRESQIEKGQIEIESVEHALEVKKWALCDMQKISQDA